MGEMIRHRTGENPVVKDEDVHKLVIEDMQKEVFSFMRDKGWLDGSRSVGDEMALLHSEVSEALEEFRAGRMVTRFRYDTGTGYVYTDAPWSDEQVLGKPVGFPSEIADVLIRLLDVAGRHNIDLVEEFRRKMAYNRTRSHRHGGKAL